MIQMQEKNAERSLSERPRVQSFNTNPEKCHRTLHLKVIRDFSESGGQKPNCRELRCDWELRISRLPVETFLKK